MTFSCKSFKFSRYKTTSHTQTYTHSHGYTLLVKRATQKCLHPTPASWERRSAWSHESGSCVCEETKWMAAGWNCATLRLGIRAVMARGCPTRAKRGYRWHGITVTANSVSKFSGGKKKKERRNPVIAVLLLWLFLFDNMQLFNGFLFQLINGHIIVLRSLNKQCFICSWASRCTATLRSWKNLDFWHVLKSAWILLFFVCVFIPADKNSTVWSAWLKK